MFRINYKIAAVFLSCIYIVGPIGHLIPDLKPIFLLLTPFNLVITLIVFLLLNPIKTKNIISLVLIFLIGYLVEILGVQTGLLFGEYHYGETLGLKILNVPLVIGLNWVLLNLAGFGLVNSVIKNKFLKAGIASLAVTLLDILIEPIAIILDYWSWKNNEIPVQNYLMWFIVSFIIQLIITKSKIQISFKSGALIFCLQLLFFITLNFAL